MQTEISTASGCESACYP